MGFEVSKTNRVRGHDFLDRYFSGSVLDIGCGDDLVVPHARPFDRGHGDAQRILEYFRPGSFDCVHSSHCLEHMEDVPGALAQWWSLVKPGGFMVLVVPDEDLYEQGYWPSVFNAEHRATFHLGKARSWSPVAYDLKRLLQGLPDCKVMDLAVQDDGYDHSLRRATPAPLGRALVWLQWKRRNIGRRLGRASVPFDRFFESFERRYGKPVDQTGGPALAQIQAVLRREPDRRL